MSQRMRILTVMSFVFLSLAGCETTSRARQLRDTFRERERSAAEWSEAGKDLGARETRLALGLKWTATAIPSGLPRGSVERTCTEDARALSVDETATDRGLELATRWADEVLHDDELARTLRCRVATRRQEPEAMQVCGAPRASAPTPLPPEPVHSPSAAPPVSVEAVRPPSASSSVQGQVAGGREVAATPGVATRSGFQLNGQVSGSPTQVGVGVHLGYAAEWWAVSLAPSFAMGSNAAGMEYLFSLALTPRFYVGPRGKAVTPYLRPEVGVKLFGGQLAFVGAQLGQVEMKALLMVGAAGGVEVMLNDSVGLTCELGLNTLIGAESPFVSTAGAIGFVVRP